MPDKISEYVADATSNPITGKDLLDFSNTPDAGSTYDVSKKIEVDEFLTYVNANADTLYNADGTLGALRTVTMGTNNLVFASSGESNLFSINAATDKIQYQDGTQANGFVLTSDANGVATWAAAAGGGNTIYTADDSLTGIRTVTQTTHNLRFLATTGDFQVSNTGNANAIIVDGLTAKVGIGTIVDTNAAKLRIQGQVWQQGRLTLGDQSVSPVVYNAMLVIDSGPSVGNQLIRGKSNSGNFFNVTGTGAAGFGLFNSGAAKVQVQGDGTGTLKTFLCEDSSGVDRFFVQDQGRVSIGASTPLAKLHIDQSSGTGAIPNLILDQADLSEEFVNFITAIGVGNPIEAVGAKTLTTTHFIKISINGANHYLQAGTIA